MLVFLAALADGSNRSEETEPTRETKTVKNQEANKAQIFADLTHMAEDSLV